MDVSSSSVSYVPTTQKVFQLQPFLAINKFDVDFKTFAGEKVCERLHKNSAEYAPYHANGKDFHIPSQRNVATFQTGAQNAHQQSEVVVRWPHGVEWQKQNFD